jgi:hypothetical protein
MNARRLLLQFSLAFVLAGMATLAPAGATTAPDHVRQEIAGARMAGQGVYTWFGLRIYEATFWTGPNGYRPGAPTAERFALNLQYARDLEGVRIAEASVKEMQKIGLGSAQQHQVWLDTMKGIFPDVRKGSQLTGVFVPDKGVRFYLDGRLLAEVPDPEFARTFFAIWLDPKTSDKGLRMSLLGEAAAAQ